jgi:hypothetical protein
MAFETQNTYKITFKDGTSFESNGSAQSDFKNLSVLEEFRWVSIHIAKEITAHGKNVEDVLQIEYKLENKTHEHYN